MQAVTSAQQIAHKMFSSLVTDLLTYLLV